MPTGYDVGAALARIENEMIDSMMRNIQRHIDEQEKEGFEWSQWQVEELRSLEEYRQRNQKKYGRQFRKINERMLEAIEEAKERGSSDQEVEILDALSKGHVPDRSQSPNGDINGAISNGFFGINESKMDALIKATENDMQRAEYAVLRRADDQYRRIIFDSQVYYNSGAATIKKAVDMATKDFLFKGIDSIQYRNGARHTIADYADMALKTAETRAYLMGQGEKRAEWGEQLVIVNKRAGDYPCPHCIPWVGKILIDDVYSGGKPDGKHKLLSEAMAAGFLHPRCRDIFTTYFPGISSEPDPVTRAEAKEAAEVEHQENLQQHAERQAEKFERLAEYSMDPDNKRVYAARAEQWKNKARAVKTEESIESAEETARAMGVMYPDYKKLPKETAELLNDAISTLPEDTRPVFVGDSSTLEKYRNSNLPRRSSQFYGVTIQAPPNGLITGINQKTGMPIRDFDVAFEDMVGISSKYNTPEKIEKAKKKAQEAYMAKHDGRKYFFNMDGKATIYHEMGHVYTNKHGLPDGWEEAVSRWYRESGYDILKNPTEAFSEAWGAYYTGNKELPEYITAFIENLEQNKALKAGIQYDEDVIIKHIKEVLIPEQKTDTIVPRQAIHRQGTKLFSDRAAKLAAKDEYGPGYITISDNEILELVEQFKGSGEVRYDDKGEWNHQEVILDNEKEIGIVVNNRTGKAVPTTVFKIHYSEKGIHIAPDYPSKKRRKRENEI